MGYQYVRLGTLYANGQAIDTKKENCSAITRWESGSEIAIKDTVEEKAIQWVKPDGMNLLIADRVLLTDVSWNDLQDYALALGQVISIDGQRYRCRLIRLNEWVTALHKTTKADKLWHWRRFLFWGIERAKENVPMMPGPTSGGNWYKVCGNNSPLYWNSAITYMREANLGYRPVLEILGPGNLMSAEKVDLEGEVFVIAPVAGMVEPVFYPILMQIPRHAFMDVPNGSELKMYTLLCNGKPVRQTQKIPYTRSKDPELTLTDKFYGKDYLISWTVSNGIAIANRPILKIG